jgi:hypothetical protein
MEDARMADLGRLLEEDRGEDRSIIAGSPEYAALRARDALRRQQVNEVLRQRSDLSADQLFAAAWILNHGDTVEEAGAAHELAKRATEKGLAPARWLAAAALDRSLMYAGRPQRYGTNIVPDGVRYRLWDVDPDTTDAERLSETKAGTSPKSMRASTSQSPAIWQSIAALMTRTASITVF